MANINANIVVEPIDITIQQSSPGITVTPTAFILNVVPGSGGGGNPGGNIGALQYNAGGSFGGVPDTSFSNNKLTLGNVSNIKITGGVNGYVLETDGLGNLSWTAQTGGGGNGSPGGANKQIQYNDGGLFNGNPSFTFDEVSNIVSIANLEVYQTSNLANVIVANGTIVTPGFYGNITGANVISAYTFVALDGINTANVNSNLVTSNNIVSINSNISNSNANVATINILNSNTSTLVDTIFANSIKWSSNKFGIVNQSGNRNSNVTLNLPSGRITLVSASVPANNSNLFALLNTSISPDDFVIIQHISGGTMGKYNVTATPSFGFANIVVRNNSNTASASESITLQYMVVKN